MNDILVIIPTYNEEMNIGGVIDELRRDFCIADILVVNDCSSDNTVGVLKSRNVDYITTTFNSGYSGALQLGFKYAKLKNYKYVIQFDGDGQHIALEALKLYNTMKSSKADIVIGSRFLKKTNYKHGFFRKIGTNLFVKIIKLVSNSEILDPTSGFQILSEKVYSYYSGIGNFPDYPDANLIIFMLLKGYNVEEVSVNMRERVYGVSMHSGILKPIKYMIEMIYSIILIVIGNFIFKGKE